MLLYKKAFTYKNSAINKLSMQDGLKLVSKRVNNDQLLIRNY